MSGRMFVRAGHGTFVDFPVRQDPTLFVVVRLTKCLTDHWRSAPHGGAWEHVPHHGLGKLRPSAATSRVRYQVPRIGPSGASRAPAGEPLGHIGGARPPARDRERWPGAAAAVRSTGVSVTRRVCRRPSSGPRVAERMPGQGARRRARAVTGPRATSRSRCWPSRPRRRWRSLCRAGGARRWR